MYVTAARAHRHVMAKVGQSCGRFPSAAAECTLQSAEHMALQIVQSSSHKVVLAPPPKLSSSWIGRIEVFRRIESFLSNGPDRLTDADDKWCGRTEGGFRPIGATSTECKATPARNCRRGYPIRSFWRPFISPRKLVRSCSMFDPGLTWKKQTVKD